MSPDYAVKTLMAVRLVARRATLDVEALSEHIGPMFDAVAERLHHVPGSLATPVATYAQTDAGIDVVVGYAYGGQPPEGTEVVDLPQEQAVWGVHLGPVSTIGQSWQDLHRWVADHGYRLAGPARELYLRAESEDQADWVTELQQPVALP